MIMVNNTILRKGFFMEYNIYQSGVTKMRDIAEPERPRERLIQYGPKYLSNAELLAIIISCGTKEDSALTLAHRVLSLENGNLLHFSSYSPEEFQNLKGIGVATACKIAAAIEFGKRVSGSVVSDDFCDTPSQVMTYCDDLRHSHQEVFRILMLNTKKKIIAKEDVTVGGLAFTSADPREVFANAIRKGAAAVILVHNHPSGDPNPSKADIDATRQLIYSGELLKIRVLDHVIIGDGVYYSFKEQNNLF